MEQKKKKVNERFTGKKRQFSIMMPREVPKSQLNENRQFNSVSFNPGTYMASFLVLSLRIPCWPFSVQFFAQTAGKKQKNVTWWKRLRCIFMYSTVFSNCFLFFFNLIWYTFTTYGAKSGKYCITHLYKKGGKTKRGKTGGGGKVSLKKQNFVNFIRQSTIHVAPHAIGLQVVAIGTNIATNIHPSATPSSAGKPATVYTAVL